MVSSYTVININNYMVSIYTDINTNNYMISIYLYLLIVICLYTFT